MFFFVVLEGLVKEFELVHSEFKLNVLNLTLHLVDGFIQTDVYAKPTDSNLYLPYDSCKNSIPYGVALRLKEIVRRTKI